MSREPQLDPGFVRQLMRELEGALTERKVNGRMYVVGGAALALQYPDDHDIRVTTDVDAVFWPDIEVREEAARLAERYSLSPTWLNSNARPFIPDGRGDVKAHSEGFVVALADPKVLVAMKLASAREQDLSDLVLLVRHLGITAAETLVDIAFDIYGEESMSLTDSREDVYRLAVDVMAAATRATGRSTPPDRTS
ncbi:hypothetical protein [Plantibacter sp. VKM Ac-2876]|uniref:hypothetical protein n=1 Tax=Plantibacter sp. VKM Ac-2876 TaxID=2783826 RepID=UPI00188C84A0|nr:hypothetical protein [Plantibacter sp. VKM Ac-2876]MBF4564241.1 hypothetical protein [Plantibacter sp. VKM Ac-2876]